MLGQAAQASKDAQLLEIVTACHGRTTRQAVWCNARTLPINAAIRGGADRGCTGALFCAARWYRPARVAVHSGEAARPTDASVTGDSVTSRQRSADPRTASFLNVSARARGLHAAAQPPPVGGRPRVRRLRGRDLDRRGLAVELH